MAKILTARFLTAMTSGLLAATALGVAAAEDGTDGASNTDGWKTTPVPQASLEPAPSPLSAVEEETSTVEDTPKPLITKGPVAPASGPTRTLRASDFDRDPRFVRFSQPVIGNARRYVTEDTAGGATAHGTPEVLFIPTR